MCVEEAARARGIVVTVATGIAFVVIDEIEKLS